MFIIRIKQLRPIKAKTGATKQDQFLIYPFERTQINAANTIVFGVEEIAVPK